LGDEGDLVAWCDGDVAAGRLGDGGEQEKEQCEGAHGACIAWKMWEWYGVSMKVGKRFFFEKKAPRPGKQKTFGLAGVGTNAPQPAGPEVFLLLFFQKKKRLLALFRRQKGVDGPVKPGHDGWGFRRHDGVRRVWGSGGRWVC
jgi:hypothetical protein